MKKRLFKKVFFILFLLGYNVYSSDIIFIGKEEIETTARRIYDFGSRFKGYQGWKKAEDYLYSFMLNAGCKNVKKEYFDTVTPYEEECSLILPDGHRIKIHALLPNGVRTCTVHPDGLNGTLFYGRNGDLSYFEGVNLAGKIVILDFDSGRKWIELAQLGADAFIFVGGENSSSFEADEKYTAVPLNIPRFYADKNSASEILKYAKRFSKAVIKSKIVWRKVKAANIYGFVEGKSKELKNEIVILCAEYNSKSIIPAISPGAQQCANLAVYLKIMEYFIKNTPARTILFLLTGSDSEGVEEFLYQHYPNRFFEKKPDEIIIPRFFIGIDLTSQDSRLGICCDIETNDTTLDNISSMRPHFSNYTRRLMDYVEDFAKIKGENTEKLLVDCINPVKGRKPSSHFIKQMISLRAFRAGISAWTFATIYDIRTENPVGDTIEKVNFKNIEKQSETLLYIISNLVNDRKFPEKPKVELRDERAVFTGRVVYFDPKRSYVPDTPLPGAVCYLKESENSLTKQRIEFKIADENGYFRVIDTIGLYDGREIEAYVLDSLTGEIIYAPDRGINGSQTYPRLVRFSTAESRGMVVLFKCNAVNVFDFIDPQYQVPLNSMDILGVDNSIPQMYGYTINGYQGWMSYPECYGVIFVEPYKTFKVLLRSDVWGNRLLITNSVDSKSYNNSSGTGFSYSFPPLNIFTTYQSAKDIFYLNDFRINQLVEKGIKNEYLSQSHNNAREKLKESEESKKSFSWYEFAKKSLISLGIESRLYPEVKATMNDVVNGVVFYMFLILPFAYFMEKLITGYSDINKKIIAIILIFLLIYILLRVVHPVFTLIKFPEIILLGFITLALSIVVFFIILGQFEQQMGIIRKSSAKGIFSSDVSRMSTLSIAFSLGISNMRKRKVRTLLTSFTIVFLTFTIISFISVKTNLKYTKTILSGKPLYQGFLIKDTTEWPVDYHFYEYLNILYKDKAVVVPRGYYALPFSFSVPTRPFINILCEESQKEVFAYGIMGLDPAEDSVTGISRYMKEGAWFEKNDRYVCILPDKLAENLFCSVGSNIRVLGKVFNVKGIINSEKLRQLKDLDNETLTMPDFSMFSSSALQKLETARRGGLQGKALIEKVPKIDWTNVMILPFNTVKNLKVNIYTVAVKFNNPNDDLIENEARDLISRLKITLYSGIGEKKCIYSSLNMTSIGGIGNIIILMIIAGLIVFNTMLGSVYERTKEIGIYSAVGLTPRHISMLFLGEATIYSILGAIFGYILGQIAVKIMITFGLFKGLNLNYSSLSTVFATLTVMVIVLLSAMYPAKKASRISVPDVTRKWELPQPDGDDWIFEFPFTVSGIEVAGLFAFLKNFFAFYTEESIGKFYTSGTELSGSKDKFYIYAQMWLAPFDLGIKQEIRFTARNTGESNIYEIMVHIKRIEGDIKSWKLSNRYFLNLIRKEFLIWRTLPSEMKEFYKKEAEAFVSK